VHPVVLPDVPTTIWVDVTVNGTLIGIGPRLAGKPIGDQLYVAVTVKKVPALLLLVQLYPRTG
jgi:hypothetical protein